MNELQQALIARILDVLAQRFNKHAVLRGGMVLRILGSPRFTNDLDYVFVPYRSKKDIVADILDCLRSLEGVQVRHSLNSKCLRVVVSKDDVTVQVEAKVAMEEKTAVASTRSFSRQFNLPPRMVLVSDLGVALSNKLAAWNERRLARDLYDVWFFLQMGVRPDTSTLKTRLKNPVYSKLVKESERFVGRSVEEFWEFLRGHVAALSDDDIRRELVDYLAAEEIDGLAIQFRAMLVKLV